MLIIWIASQLLTGSNTPFKEPASRCEPIPQTHKFMKSEQPSHPKPSAYLWGRCEGWVLVGVFHAVVIDAARGVCVDEAGEVLLRWVDGSWRSDMPKFEGWEFDQVAVTHLPLDPHQMSRPGWHDKWIEREEKMRKLRTDKSASRKPKEDVDGDLPGMSG